MLRYCIIFSKLWHIKCVRSLRLILKVFKIFSWLKKFLSSFFYAFTLQCHSVMILSHRILVSVIQYEDMIQENTCAFQTKRKPPRQQLTHSFNSDILGGTIITPHLDTAPAKQVFFPVVCVCRNNMCVCVRLHEVKNVCALALCLCVVRACHCLG